MIVPVQLRDFIYIDDVINAIIKILKNDIPYGEIINIGSGKPHSIKKIFKICKILAFNNIRWKIKLRQDEISKTLSKYIKSKIFTEMETKN